MKKEKGLTVFTDEIYLKKLADFHQDKQNERYSLYGIYLKESQDIIGLCSLTLDQRHHVTYHFINHQFEKHYVTMLLKNVKSILKQKQINYVTKSIEKENQQAMIAYQKLGFVYKYTYKRDGVCYRLYQYNLNEDPYFVFMNYWHQYDHFIESEAIM